ncbi:MAG: hypothetical protein V3U49_03610 [Nitrososphaerales archaeon]
MRESLAPFWAIMQADLRRLFKSKITYGWLIAAIFLAVISVLTSAALGIASVIITTGLSYFIFIWSMIVIGVAASAVSSESGEFADSIMSKSVTRFDYVLAKFSSRIIYVLAIFAVVSAVQTGLALRMASNDYETYGLISSILFVALALIMLTTIGVALSIAMPNTVIAIVVLLSLWYSMVFVFPLLEELDFLSPSSLMNILPEIIQGVWNGEEWKTATGFAAISLASAALSSVYFSLKDL